MTELEKGIPMRRMGRRLAYPLLETMEVGDSFTAPYRQIDSVRNATYGVMRRPGNTKKFVTGTDPFDGTKYRVWRIA